jgi:hypothetical protein
MSSDSDRKKRKQEKNERLRKKQEEKLRKREQRITREQLGPEAMIRKGYHISSEELCSGSFSVTYKATNNYKNIAVGIIDKEEEFLNKLVP